MIAKGPGSRTFAAILEKAVVPINVRAIASKPFITKSSLALVALYILVLLTGFTQALLVLVLLYSVSLVFGFAF